MREAEAINAWALITVNRGTNIRYLDEDGQPTGNNILANFNKRSGDYYMYMLDYDSNDFGDYGLNSFATANSVNILRYQDIDVNETVPQNIYLKMQEEYVKLTESSIKLDIDISDNIDEMEVGTVLIAHLDEAYNLLARGEDIKVISTEIIEKSIEYLTKNEKKISYTTSDEGKSIKALIQGRLQSISNIITGRG